MLNLSKIVNISFAISLKSGRFPKARKWEGKQTLEMGLIELKWLVRLEWNGIEKWGQRWGVVDRVTAALNTSQNSLDWRQWAIESHYRSLGGEDLLKQVHSNPLQYSCLENLMDCGAWQATVHGISESGKWLKWLSMHRELCMEGTCMKQ